MLLTRAIHKYGLENFSKEILYVFDSEWKMNIAEKILVVPDIETNYNLCAGGKGGFGYINSKNLNWTYEKNNRISGFKNMSKEERHINAIKGGIINHEKTIARNKKTKGIFKDTSHMTTEKSINKKIETFQKINHQKGDKNSQFGTCWITNGQENKKIKKEYLDEWINKGYYKGRYGIDKPRGSVMVC